DGLSNGIVRHDIDHEIPIAVVDELMRLARFENKSVAGLDRLRAILMPHAARAGNDVVKFPLRAVRMEGIRNLPWRNAQDCHIERMPLIKVGGLRLAPERFRKASARAIEFPFRRSPRFLRHVARVYFEHSANA